MSQREVTAEALAFLRKESLDLFNRLQSIAQDILFVNKVHDFYPDIPILPNLRCGAWYTDPAIVGNRLSCVFQVHRWPFQPLELQLAAPESPPFVTRRSARLHWAVMGFGRIILVDSTRAGKRIPDALSKTVPIWCAVINRAVRQVFPEGKTETGWDTNLYTPPSAVSSQEHDQIEQRLDAWASALAHSSYELPNLHLPLRPMWITPASSGFPNLSTETRTFTPIICLSASRQVQDGVERRAGGFAYVQGSGDDHELWGMGLTPETFWSHRTEILAADRAELPALVASIVAARATARVARVASPIEKVSGLILVCATSDLPPDTCTMGRDVSHVIVGAKLPTQQHRAPCSTLQIELTWEGKKGQIQFLQDVLPRCIGFIGSNLLVGRRVCVSCDTGIDASVGIALAALARFFDDAGALSVNEPQPSKVTKQSIRTRLEWIITSRPQANPSRTTLKRVNEYLLSSSAFRGPASKPWASRSIDAGEFESLSRA